MVNDWSRSYKIISKILVIVWICKDVNAYLSVSSTELEVVNGSSINFTISLNTSVPDSTTRILLDTSGSKSVSLDLTVLHVPANIDSITWVIKLTGTHPGNAMINVSLDPPIESNKEEFIHVGVERDARLGLASDVIGWIYFTAWTISFYPQIYSNFKLKSVIGLNFDFLGLNLIGFTLYGLYNLGLYTSSLIQDEFFERNPTSANPVQLNDVFFSLHAAVATVITIFQCCIYERGTQKVSKGVIVLMLSYSLWLGAVAVMVLLHHLQWIDFLMHCSHVKLTITLVKYIPQAFMNYQRKSTAGWSIGNVLLDLTGGVFSFLQMVVLAYNFDDWEGFLIDTTKLGLGLFSVSFDILFMIQHYVLYRDSTGIYDLSGTV